MDWHFDTGLRADLFGVFREREENVMKLGKKNLLVVSVMLFALFFGAGNLIFPPFLGQNAGANTLPAMVGFLVTAVILPVLGVVVVARFDGLEKLGRQVGKRFALVFAVLIYLSIGPGLGIPRAASVPFEMAVAPYLPENSNAALWMAAYSPGVFPGGALAVPEPRQAGRPYRSGPYAGAAGAADAAVCLLPVPGGKAGCAAPGRLCPRTAAQGLYRGL